MLFLILATIVNFLASLKSTAEGFIFLVSKVRTIAELGWSPRAGGHFLLIAFWLALWLLVRRVRAVTNFPLFTLTLCASGMTLALLASNLGLAQEPIAVRLLLWTPWISVLGILIFRRELKVPLAKKDEAAKPWVHRLRQLLTLTAIIAIALKMLSASVELAWLRLAPKGDETAIWFASAIRIAQHGLEQYSGSIGYSSYTPGFGLFHAFLLGPAPLAQAESALWATPMLQGAFLLLAFYSLLPRARLAENGTALLFPAALTVRHSWVYTMLFTLWYGEGLAILAVLAIFAYLESADRPSYIDAVQIFGVGVLSILVKPPLSLIAIPIVFPMYVLLGKVFDSKFSWRAQGARAGIAMLGAIVAQVLWKWHLRINHEYGVYDLDWKQLVQPHFTEGSFPLLVEYFFRHYVVFWVNFFLIAAAALWLDFRGMIRSFTIGFGLVLSIFWLYATVWTNFGDYNSGARYIMHGMVAWCLYAIAHLWPRAKDLIFGQRRSY